MSRTTWFHRRAVQKKQPAVRCHPQLELLEDRTLLSTFIVTNLLDSGPGSLRAAIAAANARPGADLINFAPTLHGTITLTTGQLSVTDALTISGPGAGKLTVSGNDASRVFDIGIGTTVTIAGLTIAHGRADTTGGGGIRNEAGATLSLVHDTLSSNRAVGVAGLDEFGGALLNLGHATITASWFTNNQVLGGGSFTAIGGSAGGAIDNFGGASLMVADSLFTNNRAVSADGAGFFALGGAIENNAGLNGFDPTLATPSTAILTHSTFLDNLAQGGTQASSNGGAILSEGLGTSMTLTGCLIDGNRSVGGEGGANNAVGGGIQNIGIMEIDGCTITNNQAVGGNNGAITTANPFAGGAFGGGIENNFQAVLHITHSLIAGNLAQGGASATGPGSDAFGGGISNSPNATMTVTNSAIVNNWAIAGQGGPGGNNVPAGFGIGGGIDNSGSSTATLVDCLIAGNLAQGSAGGTGANGGDGVGGGLAAGAHVLLGLTDNSQLTVRNCIIVGNQALGGAGSQGANGGDGLGGGLAIFAGSSATITGSKVASSIAQGGVGGSGGSAGHGIGGGIDNAGTLSVANTTLSNNQALGGMGGGGIRNGANASLTITDSLLSDNHATAASATVDVFGGGLLNEGTATVASSTFRGNQALGGGGSSFFGGSVGGAIDNFGGATLTVIDSAFVNNQALGAAGMFNFGIGGAIENNSGFNQTTPSTATVNNSTFIGNLASGADQVTGNGGAIDNEGTGATMILSNSKVLDNQSLGAAGGGEGRGGGIMNVFGSKLTVLNCIIAENRAGGGTGAAGLFPNFLDGRGIGGGIDNVLGATLTVVDSTLRGNQALGGSGSTFGGTLATSNVGDGDGGGIDNGDGPGGAINPGMNGAGSTLTIIDSTISDNLATGGSTSAGRGGTGQGGGIINVTGTLTVISSKIAGNLAGGGTGGSGFQTGFGIGGGIDSLAGGSASVNGSTLTGNKAIGGAGSLGANGGNGVGGAINVGIFGGPDSATLQLINSTLDHNKAVGGVGGVGGTGGDGLGGGLAALSGTMTVSSSILDHNRATGGDGGEGGNGGNGFGGGIYIASGSSISVTGSKINHNRATGGEGNDGGSDGLGIGGGVYNLGTFTFDFTTNIKKNHASTSNDDLFP